MRERDVKNRRTHDQLCMTLKVFTQCYFKTKIAMSYVVSVTDCEQSNFLWTFHVCVTASKHARITVRHVRRTCLRCVVTEVYMYAAVGIYTAT